MSLEIVIVTAGMPFGPDTLEKRSLGGSETAALSLAKALKANGHIVTVFTHLPTPDREDHVPSGSIGSDGVRYVDIQQYGAFVANTEVDLLIGLRNPEIFKVPHQARRAVLWNHDLATYHGPAKMIGEVAWNITDVWCVSDFHADQYAKVTGYPRDRITVMRNCITHQNVVDYLGRDKHQLLYFARPERGLEALVRPNGIMSRLPGNYTLLVAMYDNFPPHMAGFYEQIKRWGEALPNVKFLGSLNQGAVRQLMRNSGAYVYPTDFEETSCILAQEAMEQKLPFIYSPKGALAETLRGWGTKLDGAGQWNSDDYCANFADAIQMVVENHEYDNPICPEPRYWEDAAREVEGLMERYPEPCVFSRIWSLVEDSDVIPAIALTKSVLQSNPEYPPATLWMSRLESLYPYLFGKETFASYYERYFVREDSKGARQRRSMVGNPRFEAIASEVAQLPPDATVLDYGCAEGVIILDLAKRFPTRRFVGIDFAATNIALCQKYAADMELSNVEFHVGSTDEWPDALPLIDAVICTEVLEHVEKPWEVINILENKVLVGGRVIVTVPAGPWEAIGLYDKNQYWWRAHIWHINKWMLRQMFGDKKNCRMSSLPNGHVEDGRALGHLTWSYDADHLPVHPVDPLEKARRHRHRETTTACMIVDNADMLQRTLKSIGRQVQALIVSVTTKDDIAVQQITQAVNRFELDHPWVHVRLRESPVIEVEKFGFDDARNYSIREVYTDWVLWIDSDEYLSGDFRKYMRPNAFDSYAISQHHFSCDPPGAPPMVDKPARLFRTNRQFKFYGKVHEHAENGFNKGPGFAMVLGDVHIGHIGYVNEGVRRDRFSRNFPFLEWDHRVNADRKLSRFLWLRDIVQRMRYIAEQGQTGAAAMLAHEAVDYYRKHWDDWTEAGMGGMQALDYFSEAQAFLGNGLPVQVEIKIQGEATQVRGIFETNEEMLKAVGVVTKGKFEQRNSGYWQ